MEIMFIIELLKAKRKRGGVDERGTRNPERQTVVVPESGEVSVHKKAKV
jgi:hypothetical protein